MKNQKFLPLVAGIAGTASFAFAADAVPAKTYGAFFAPVAIEDRRAMSIDRPNVTDAPYSINSGVLQIETSALEYTKDTYAGVKTQVFAVGTTNVRVGLKDNWELQTIVNPYTAVRQTSPGVVNTAQGFGDTVLRTRYVVRGNDGVGTAIAILPYVKLPTNQLHTETGVFNDKIEGGLEIPVAYALNVKTTLVAMAGTELIYSGQSAHHYDPNPFVSAAVWYALTPEFSGFGEVYAKKNTGYGTDSEIVTVATGGIWQATKDIAVDLGVQLGVTEGAPDCFFKTGVSVRF